MFRVAIEVRKGSVTYCEEKEVQHSVTNCEEKEVQHTLDQSLRCRVCTWRIAGCWRAGNAFQLAGASRHSCLSSLETVPAGQGSQISGLLRISLYVPYGHNKHTPPTRNSPAPDRY
jgi:hypothetical protein